MTTPFLLDCDGYYRRESETEFLPSIHVQGAWNPHEQHMAPVTGLLSHALLRHEPRADMQFSRLSLDILGVIHAGPTTVTTRTLRPGRTIELIEATASVAGREVVRARAWRLQTQDTSDVAATEETGITSPQATPPWDGMKIWGGGFIASLQVRADPSSRPGRATVWIRTPIPLLSNEASSALPRFLCVADAANGVAARHQPDRWAFPNTDLTIHLLREPVGEWTGLDASVSWGPTGLGITSAVLHDEHGPVGRSEQSLTLRRR